MLCVGHARVGVLRRSWWAVWDGERLHEGTRDAVRPVARAGYADRGDDRAGDGRASAAAGDRARCSGREIDAARAARRVGRPARARGRPGGGRRAPASRSPARRSSWNLVDGLHDGSPSERTVWVDGEPHEVGRRTASTAWTASATCASRPRATRARARTTCCSRSDYEQPFGTFSGLAAGRGRAARGLGRDGAPRGALVIIAAIALAARRWRRRSIGARPRRSSRSPARRCCSRSACSTPDDAADEAARARADARGAGRAARARRRLRAGRPVRRARRADRDRRARLGSAAARARVRGGGRRDRGARPRRDGRAAHAGGVRRRRQGAPARTPARVRVHAPGELGVAAAADLEPHQPARVPRDGSVVRPLRGADGAARGRWRSRSSGSRCGGRSRRELEARGRTPVGRLRRCRARRSRVLALTLAGFVAPAPLGLDAAWPAAAGALAMVALARPSWRAVDLPLLASCSASG